MNTSSWVVVGLDNGGNCNSATVLDGLGRFLVDRLVESPSRVREGPGVAVEALAEALDHVLGLTGVTRESVRAVGLGTPGPASRDGVISSKGATNFSQAPWRGFDYPRRARASPGHSGRLQQRRQRRGALRPSRPFRPRGGVALLGLGDRRNGPRGGSDRGRACHPRGRRDGRRAWPCPHTDARTPRRWAASSRMQLRLPGRCGERRLTDRDREEPPAVLADALSGP